MNLGQIRIKRRVVSMAMCAVAICTIAVGFQGGFTSALASPINGNVDVLVYENASGSEPVARAVLNPQNGTWSSLQGGFSTNKYGTHRFGVVANYQGVSHNIESFNHTIQDNRPLASREFDPTTGTYNLVPRTPKSQTDTVQRVFTANDLFSGERGDALADKARNAVEAGLPDDQQNKDETPDAEEAEPTEETEPTENLQDPILEEKNEERPVEVEITTFEKEQKRKKEAEEADDGTVTLEDMIKNPRFKRVTTSCYSDNTTEVIEIVKPGDVNLTLYLMVLVETGDAVSEC